MDIQDQYGWCNFRVQSLRSLVRWFAGNGHTIMGLPNEETLDRMGWNVTEAVIFGTKIKTYESDLSNPKSTIYTDNGPVDSLRGWHTLDVLWSIAEGIEADTKEAASKMGRGFQAQALSASITSRLEEIANMCKQHGKPRPDLGARLVISLLVEPEEANV